MYGRNTYVYMYVMTYSDLLFGNHFHNRKQQTWMPAFNTYYINKQNYKVYTVKLLNKYFSKDYLPILSKIVLSNIHYITKMGSYICLLYMYIYVYTTC